MRGIVTWCVGALPFGANSRRAIDETLADWAYEEDYVKTGGERWRAGLRGVLSVALVVSLSIGRETFDFKWGHGLARRCGVVAGLAVLLTLLSGTMLPVAGTIEMIPVVLLGIPLHLLIVTPPAIYLLLIPLFEYTIGSSFVTVGEAPSSWFTPGIASWTTASVIMLVALIYGRRDTPVHLT